MHGEGTGIRIQCPGPELLVQGNAIVDNCRKVGSSVVVTDSGGVVLRDNVVTDHAGGCGWSVLVNRTRDVRIEGGRIDSGPGTAAGVLAVGTAEVPTTGLVLRKLSVTGRGAGVGIYLAPTSLGTTLYDSACGSGYPTAFVDQSPDGALRVRDPDGACSP
jgi:nitrous oxidase accessory protein NosD